MDMKTAAKSVAAGAAAGFAWYAFTSANAMQKHNIKKNAGKTIKSAESLFHDIVSVFN